jgi:hypothetical protein
VEKQQSPLKWDGFKKRKTSCIKRGRGLGKSGESGRHEPVGAVIHIFMETTQGISLCSYFYLKLAKMPCFSNYVFSSIKSEMRRAEQVLSGVGVGRPDTGGREEMKGKGRRVTMVQIMYTHVCKYKNDS